MAPSFTNLPQFSEESDPTVRKSELDLVSTTLPDLLTKQSRLTPKALAIDSYEGQWTFAQVTQEIRTTVGRLQKEGVRSGMRVGLCFHLSRHAVVNIMSIMSLAAIAVPVDPLHPPARKVTMLREAGVSIVLSDISDIQDSWAEEDFRVVDTTDVASSKKADTLSTDDNPSPHPSDAAIIAFTSGSTGKPKGIVLTHEGIATMSLALAKQLAVTSISRVAQFHPYIFDVAMMEITMSFGVGATLCISKRRDMMLPAPGEVGAELNRSRITHVTLSPTMLSTIEPCQVPTVEVLSVMGEPLGRTAVSIWAHHPGRLFYQLWGCTEASILQSITLPLQRDSNPQNIGHAIAGVCRLRIVDPDDVDVLKPRGQSGELVVQSRCLALGYIGQPIATSKSFLESAAWKPSNSDGRLYRTGDLARMEQDGSITFLGRLDSQINYHGERIELGEIDFYLDQHRRPEAEAYFSDFHWPSQTVVGFVCGGSAQEHTGNGDILGSRDACKPLCWDQAIVPKSALKDMVEALVCKGELPTYMIPHFWIPIRHRPLTLSGKTDRNGLRRMMESLSRPQWSEYAV